LDNEWGLVVGQVGVQWSEGDSWLVGERAEGAGSVGEVEREWCRRWGTGAMGKQAN